MPLDLSELRHKGGPIIMDAETLYGIKLRGFASDGIQIRAAITYEPKPRVWLKVACGLILAGVLYVATMLAMCLGG